MIRLGASEHGVRERENNASVGDASAVESKLWHVLMAAPVSRRTRPLRFNCDEMKHMQTQRCRF